MLGIDNDYDAWCVDEAVSAFGHAVDAEIDEAVRTATGSDAMKRGAGENAMRKMLGLARKFASPTPGGIRPPAKPRPSGWED